MDKIYSLDQKIINSSLENIFKTLADFSTYEKWYPNDVKVRILNLTDNFLQSKIEIKYLGSKFNCEIVKIDPNKNIVVEYSGIYSGRGTWFFTPGANGVKVMYEVDLAINNLAYKILSKLLNISEIHSKKMSDLLKHLENYILENFDNGKSNINNNAHVQPRKFNISGN